jgi:H-type lectin domain
MSRLNEREFDADVRVGHRRHRYGDHHATRILDDLRGDIGLVRSRRGGRPSCHSNGGQIVRAQTCDSPDWALQNLPSGGPTIWTSPPIPFARPFGTKPTVSVAIAGIESGANLDTDRFGFSVEPTDVDASGFKITIRRIQGVLYGVTVTWLAHGANKP